MTTETEQSNNPNQQNPQQRNPYKTGRIMAGFIVVVVGAIFLLRNMGVVFPDWLFTWPMFLIVLGIFIGAKHSFRSSGWWVVSLVGLVFLADRLMDNVNIGHMFWPVIIIVVGLIMIFKPKRHWHGGNWRENRKQWEDKYRKRWEDKHDNRTSNAEDYIESVSIFGGIKKNIISKDFKGGEIVCIFGGAEINLMQADINGRVDLEVTQVFGGTKLIVPAHWEVIQKEMVAILGGIEDKRPPYSDKTLESPKVLVISGVSIFGGIDIRSY